MLAFYGQVVVNGLISGLIYALTAAGFSLLYGNAGILFFAIGDAYMLGAILFHSLIVKMGLPYLAAMPIVLALLGLFGVALEMFIFRRMRGNDLTFAFASLAVGLLIAGLALELFGEQGKGLPSPFPGRFKLMGIMLTWDKVVIVSTSLIILLGLHFFFLKSKLGRSIRAVSQDLEAAQLMGIDVNLVKAVTFFLALAVAGGAGALVTPLYYADVFMGPPVLMTTLIVVVLGGLGSYPGAIIGGVLIGLIESFGYTFLGGVTTVLMFLVVIGVLILRPQGLLGRE